ncbi:hypothetical protein PBY51_023188 [Eleginops maclovinus]|uniref:SOWAHA-C winged helix-turn-helix domain-containing protein n=1 Tax=Eleginops maclovinus TaxID=56733 RepID=A0AAN7X0C8_ELEMC|nr:hypothetical protein PBY51_023188 [Eleginops maclovinus]
MGTDFTQDALLHFLQCNGGSVKNTDLILHFKDFIRDNPDQKRNRELFKKFVNSVATVRQVEGVSYVVLRKKFKGYVPGNGEGGSSERLPAAKGTDTCPENGETPRQKPELREVTTPAPPGVTAGKTSLPVAGIMPYNNNTVQKNLNVRQQQVSSTPDVCGRPAAVSQTPAEPPAQHLITQVGQQRVGSGPGVTPVVASVRQETPHLHQEPPLHHNQVPPLRQTLPLHQGAPLPQTPPLHQVPPLHQTPPLHQEPPLHHNQVPPLRQTLPLHQRAPLPQTPLLHQVPPLRQTPPLHQEPPLQQLPLIHHNRTPPLPQTPPLHQVPPLRQTPPLHQEPPLQQLPLIHHNQEPLLHQEPPLHRTPPLPQVPPLHQNQVPPLRQGPPPQQTPPLHQTPVLLQSAPRLARHRPSYKSALSYDEDEEEEEVQVRRGSAVGAWPLSYPLGGLGNALSTSSPCIIDQQASPPISSSSSPSYSPERKLPKIYVQEAEEERLQGRRGPASGPTPGSVSGEVSSTRRSLPLEAERYTPSSDRATELVPRRDGPRYGKPAAFRQGPHQSRGQGLSSSHSSLFSPSSDPDFSRGSGWNSSCDELQAKAGAARGGSQIQEVIQRTQGSHLESVTQHADSKTTGPRHPTGHLHDNQEPTGYLSPFYHSTDHLHDDQVVPWHLSTGDLCDDREDAESSEGSTSSQPRRGAARRISSRLRSRMCRSLGADLDQLLQEDARAGGGSEAARLNRLHLISSSLSLRYDLSNSSLSSCSTPPSCHSFADLGEVKGGRRSSPGAPSSSTAEQEGPNRKPLVPLEPKEHVWLVKGAAGAWPDIYTLFREDSSLLNRQDFISGFTVLHWIAKHGDHRVLNTLWYGVQKAGLTFDVNARSTCGHTPLHIAAMHGHKNIMRLLVTKFGADVKLRDTAGKKPWQYLSRTTAPDVFQLLGAPARAAGGEGGGVGTEDPSGKQRQTQPRRRRHHLSFASSSSERPLTGTGTTRVKRSSSIAAFLKHKSLQTFYRNQSDSSV